MNILRTLIQCMFAPVLLVAGFASAAPYAPSSDATVLEQLPFRPGDPLARELKQLRTEWQRNPRDPETAVRLARRYYDQVGEDGDPRYLGYAQAALAPWWTMETPPLEVQVLRASLRQFLHDFTGAVRDLDQVLARQPDHEQARSLRATIHIVQARYEQARADCEALHGVATELIATGCEAMVDGLTGKAASAYDKLAAAFDASNSASPAHQLWVLTRLAELAQRLGRHDVAEKRFKQALALGIPDTFLFAAYADFLLDRNRPQEVVELLKDKVRSDTLFLRLVFAERAVKAPTAAGRQATLAARFDAARLRGDTVHQQEEARFALQVENDPQKALALSQENWAVQREPRDARIFMESAIAAKDAAAARSVLQWMEKSGIEDRHLIGLSQQLKGMKQ